MDGVKVTVLASQLLRHAAEFFDFVAEQNPDLADMMQANREGYRMMADRLETAFERAKVSKTP